LTAGSLTSQTASVLKSWFSLLGWGEILPRSSSSGKSGSLDCICVSPALTISVL